MELIYKYELYRRKSLNGVTNRWNTCMIKETSQDPDNWFNVIYNLNLKLKKIKENYDKYEDQMKAHMFGILPEQ